MTHLRLSSNDHSTSSGTADRGMRFFAVTWVLCALAACDGGGATGSDTEEAATPQQPQLLEHGIEVPSAALDVDDDGFATSAAGLSTSTGDLRLRNLRTDVSMYSVACGSVVTVVSTMYSGGVATTYGGDILYSNVRPGTYSLQFRCCYLDGATCFGERTACTLGRRAWPCLCGNVRTVPVTIRAGRTTVVPGCQ